MRIVVNGQARDVSEGLSLAELIRALGLERAAVAAEVNKALVPKRAHASATLREGDQVELVSLVGGG